MKQVCYCCKEVFGEKEPYNDMTESHGLCPTHFISEKERIRQEIIALKKKGIIKVEVEVI